MKNTRRFRTSLAASTVLALSIALVPAAAAQATAASATTQEQDELLESWALADLQDEIDLLSTLTDEELSISLRASIAAHEESIGTAPAKPTAGEEGSIRVKRALPAVPVIVWALGCGLAGISSVATSAWRTANGAAWAIAGILVGCIPGVAQANIVKVILANRGAIAKGLRAVGLTAPALALSGSSPRR